jgi:peptide deformylase
VSLLDIYVLGAPILREETVPVTDTGPELQKLVDDMFETMYAAKGIGLAAPQVGRTERVAVIDVEGAKHVIVNPEIVLREGSQKGEEGCLSIPDVYADIERAMRVIVRARDREGAPIEIEATELLARCLQHEIDHLHGKLFIDHLGLLKKRAALKKWEKLRAGDKSLTRPVAALEVAQHHHRDEEL